MLRNAPFRPLKFTIVVHREEIKGSKDTYRVDMIRDTDNAWMVDPDWVAFKRHIEAGPIGYNEEEDEIWWYRPDSGREVRIMDEGSFYDAIGTLLETFNSPRMWMQVEKKPVGEFRYS